MFPDEIFGFKRIIVKKPRKEIIESYKNDKNIYLAISKSYRTKKISIRQKREDKQYKTIKRFDYTEVNIEVIEELKKIAQNYAIRGLL